MLGDEYYMHEALKQARLAYEANEVPVGAVVVASKQIIARAHNQTEQLKDVTAHAEMLAITAAANALGSKYLANCTLYVTLQPCAMCAAALKWSQIPQIVYGAEDEKFGFHLTAPHIFNKKTTVLGGVLAEDAAALLQQFFQQKRNLNRLR